LYAFCMPVKPWYPFIDAAQRKFCTSISSLPAWSNSVYRIHLPSWDRPEF
jgi:hypothetical protein